jgi:hypothetical protein
MKKMSQPSYILHKLKPSGCPNSVHGLNLSRTATKPNEKVNRRSCILHKLKLSRLPEHRTRTESPTSPVSPGKVIMDQVRDKPWKGWKVMLSTFECPVYSTKTAWKHTVLEVTVSQYLLTYRLQKNEGGGGWEEEHAPYL